MRSLFKLFLIGSALFIFLIPYTKSLHAISNSEKVHMGHFYNQAMKKKVKAEKIDFYKLFLK